MPGESTPAWLALRMVMAVVALHRKGHQLLDGIERHFL
jgi:hypothetical protein